MEMWFKFLITYFFSHLISEIWRLLNYGNCFKFSSFWLTEILGKPRISLHPSIIFPPLHPVASLWVLLQPLSNAHMYTFHHNSLHSSGNTFHSDLAPGCGDFLPFSDESISEVKRQRRMIRHRSQSTLRFISEKLNGVSVGALSGAVKFFDTENHLGTWWNGQKPPPVKLAAITLRGVKHHRGSPLVESEI